MEYEEKFPLRLALLRTKMGISARDMSLSIGQNPGYIHNIESGKALPSMSAFFFICEFLKVTPAEFFEMDVDYPLESKQLIDNLKHLKKDQLYAINTIINGLVH